MIGLWRRRDKQRLDAGFLKRNRAHEPNGTRANDSHFGARGGRLVHIATKMDKTESVKAANPAVSYVQNDRKNGDASRATFALPCKLGQWTLTLPRKARHRP